MSYPETKDWRVIDVREGKTEPNPHGGQFQKFYVDFEGAPDTYWRRNAGDIPEVGHNYFGTVSKGDYGLKFKKEKLPDGYEASTGSPRPSNASSKGQGNGDVDWDRKDAEKRRCHSQEMALRYLIAKGEPFDLESVWRISDEFDRDDIDAGKFHSQKASQGAGAGTVQGDSPAPSPGLATPAPPSERDLDLSGARTEEPGVDAVVKAFDATVIDDRHQWMEDRLINGGAPMHFAGTLARYALDQLKPEDLKKLEALLNSHETLSEGAKRLEASYVKTVGPIPAPADDDIPF